MLFVICRRTTNKTHSTEMKCQRAFLVHLYSYFDVEKKMSSKNK